MPFAWAPSAPGPQAVMERACPPDRRRWRLRPYLPANEPPGAVSRRSARPASSREPRSPWPWTGLTELYREGRYELAVTPHPRLGRHDRAVAPLADRYPIVRRGRLAEDAWAGWVPSPRLWTQAPVVATTWRDNTRASARPGLGRGQLHPHQGQPDRTLTETFDASDLAHRATTRRWSAPLGRDRGHHHRRHSCPSARARSDRCAPRTGPCAKYNIWLRIEEKLGDGPRYPRRQAFPRHYPACGS